MPYGPTLLTGNSDALPDVVIRPTEWLEPTYHNAPSGPAAIAYGPIEPWKLDTPGSDAAATLAPDPPSDTVASANAATNTNPTRTKPGFAAVACPIAPVPP